jgi:peptidoglycan/LPS O-acetylase OafA/YrhL
LSIPLIVLFTATLLYETAHFPMKRYFYCLLVFVAVPFLFLWTHKSKIDSYIGELSYPMYMCHMLVRSVLLWLGVSSMNNVALPLVVITILLSLALNQWVANPVERIRQARVRAASSSAIAAHGSSEVAART